MTIKAFNTETLTGTYAKDAAALANAVKTSGADVVLFAGTSAVRRSVAAAALRAGAEIDTNVVDATLAGEAVTVQKWAYRQRILTSFTRAAKPWVIVTDPSLFGEICGKLGSSAETLPACGDVETRTVQNGLQAASGGGESTIRPDAELLFVAGAGWTKKQADGAVHLDEAAAAITGFISKSGASLGSSKSLVDMPEAFDLLPRRGASRGGLALHQRETRSEPGRQLRLGAGQGGRALRGRRVRGNEEGQRAARLKRRKGCPE